MPTIAQKLCHEIVEPAIKPSTESKKITAGKSNKSSNLRKNDKLSQFVQFEKKKDVTKIKPSSTTASISHGLKSSKIVYRKKLVNSAINTIITGPLKCDHNCLTLIHKRDSTTCKCSKKKVNIKGSCKEIQTLYKKNYSISDEACTHCIETISCSTQFFDNINGILKQGYKRSNCNIKINSQNSNGAYTSIAKVIKRKFLNENSRHHIEKPYFLHPCLRLSNGKYWTISYYPTRGPDF